MDDKQRFNIGLVGYGFMGRTHSNAYQQVSRFFDLEYRPVLESGLRAQSHESRSVCARSGAINRLKRTGERWSSDPTSI